MLSSPVLSSNVLLSLVRETVLPDLPADFPADGDLFEAGLDSMGVMQLVMFLEERFGKKVEPEELSRANFRSGAALAALVNGGTAGAGNGATTGVVGAEAGADTRTSPAQAA